MKVSIIGSGGCVSIPRPCCNCPICMEAREKGVPYARTGSSLWIEDVNLIIDTPEDINYAINHAKVNAIDYILYSHCDPDHTMGMRIMEQLRMDWLQQSVGVPNSNPITVATLPVILEDIKQQGTKYGSALDYYEAKRLVITKGIRSLTINGIHIDLVPVDESEHVAIFVITENDKKIIYAPCDVKPFPNNELFYDADILIIGNTIIGDILKDGFVLQKDNPLRNELFVMDEVVELKRHYNIGEVIITHLEEDWGKSYEDYKALEKQYNGIRFAYDGLKLY